MTLEKLGDWKRLTLGDLKILILEYWKMLTLGDWKKLELEIGIGSG